MLIDPPKKRSSLEGEAGVRPWHRCPVTAPVPVLEPLSWPEWPECSPAMVWL
jgi:hypothetical protein